ncbi:MAG: PhzF family phenazine biosynthesis isomerase [Rhabdochlamydiaceae bacterium]|nr:PhzF family phenazine biosynthesis isomerase [Rhabdochlamydiaceae bacterium]
MKIWIVDAFTDHPYAGNPAAVVIVDEFPDNEICQKIAAEMNLSETAFVKQLNANHFHLRWFTPKVEVKLCGHGTLASAHILHQEKLVNGKEILFESLSGQLKVYSSSSNYTLDFPLQKTGEVIEFPSIKSNFGEVIQAVQAYDDVIIELPNEEHVRKYIPCISELEKIACRGIIITSKCLGSYDFISRFFAPKVGVNEDPVTGSAHCKLAHYWQQKLNKSDFVAYQASPRGGEIRISIIGDRVHLTGKAVTILAGVWQVPLRMEKMKNSSQRVQDILHAHNLGIRVIEFKELTRTSQEAANTIGCEVGQIAKTLIFKGRSTGKPICVIASGKNRVDEKKIARLVGEEIEKPDAEYVLKHTSFAIGGVPPIGYEFDIKPLIDKDLVGYQEIWAAAGTPNSVFRLTPNDLLKITHGIVADIHK